MLRDKNAHVAGHLGHMLMILSHPEGPHHLSSPMNQFQRPFRLAILVSRLGWEHGV